jgi:hypothetical protein
MAQDTAQVHRAHAPQERVRSGRVTVVGNRLQQHKRHIVERKRLITRHCLQKLCPKPLELALLHLVKPTGIPSVSPSSLSGRGKLNFINYHSVLQEV